VAAITFDFFRFHRPFFAIGPSDQFETADEAVEHFNIRVSRILTRTRNNQFTIRATCDESMMTIAMMDRQLDNNQIRGEIARSLHELARLWTLRYFKSRQSSAASTIFSRGGRFAKRFATFEHIIAILREADWMVHSESDVISEIEISLLRNSFINLSQDPRSPLPREIVRSTLPSRMHGGTLRNNGCIALPTVQRSRILVSRALTS